MEVKSETAPVDTQSTTTNTAKYYDNKKDIDTHEYDEKAEQVEVKYIINLIIYYFILCTFFANKLSSWQNT